MLGPQPRILILGSMPSVLSLQRRQYYGNPRNAFWPLMGVLFGAGPELPYAQRAGALTAAGIAVWDVVAAGVRPGSLDSSILMASIAANDFAQLFSAHPTVSHVFFNGRKAEEIYGKKVRPTLSARHRAVQYACLPSTSPAMAALDFSGKLQRWQIISEVHRELV